MDREEIRRAALAEWDRDPGLRAEFGHDAERWVYYCFARARGAGRTIGAAAGNREGSPAPTAEQPDFTRADVPIGRGGPRSRR